MICTLFTGLTSKEGIFMRYSHEYKLECVELFRQGKFPDTPDGTNTKRFRQNIRDWAKMEANCGPEILNHKNFNKKWSPAEKYELVAKAIAGSSITDVALKAGINPGMLHQWIQKYKTQGYNGLVEQKKGRPRKNPDMKKKETLLPNPLTESEREELIRLRAENEYIKAENEVIKKRIALRQEKEAALLKATKQRSSKNSAKKDIS